MTLDETLDISIQRLSYSTSSIGSVQKPSLFHGKLPNTARRQFILGLALLMVVVFLWTSSNFALFQEGYDKPFLVTYMNTSAFSLYLLLFFWRKKGLSAGSVGFNTESMFTILALNLIANYTPTQIPLSDNDSLPLTIQETAKLALLFCFIWFIANWTVNASLNYTSIASATILSSMSGFFTLGIGHIFLVEVLSLGKVAAVLMSFLGVMMVSISDSSSPGTQKPQPVIDGPPEHTLRPLLGDTLALLSAVFYAFYVILLKVRIRTESRIDMQLFFGFVGLFNILLCWPIGMVLHFTGVEHFELPTTAWVVMAILTNMLVTLSSDYIYVLAMLKTTPLVVTIGLSLTIPLAVIGDFFFGKSTNGQVLIGAALVLVSFIVVGIDNMYAVTGVNDEA
ncbi:hypothetical protein BDZ94DRAFT_1168927 [Collybia nuda]|uniref:EamA domain-containing protein n=1 Tax=Collybia nuda TaxID=64659 RepID=A0A9P6CG20_9AGAR|nr:hypothetical protein BDZ94DRAFT_1168927 [Collybia nuda]